MRPHRPQVVSLGLIVFFMVVGGGISDAPKALEISVHGESQMDMSVDAAGTSVHIQGELRDDLGATLPQMGIDISLRSQGDTVLQERFYTDYFGRFSALVEVAPGTYDVEANYRGTSHVAESESRERITIEAAQTQLQIGAPSWVHGADGDVIVWIEASAGGRGLPSFASVMINGEDVASVDLDAGGHANVDVGPFLEPGGNDVSVEIPGTDYREAAVEETTIKRVDDPEVVGELGRVFFRMVRGLEVALEIQDGGETLPDFEVDLVLERTVDPDRDHRAEPVRLREAARADVDGLASVVFHDADLGHHEWSVSAIVAPPAGPVIPWDGGTVQHGPSTWERMVRSLVWLALIAAVLWIGRRGVLALWEQTRQRFARKEAEADDEASLATLLEEVEDVAITSFAGPADGAEDEPRGLRLQLWDEWNEKPVSGATLTLNGPGGEVETLEASAQGIVEVPAVAPGKWTLRADAPGFVAARVELSMPATLGWARVSMTAVPLKIRRAYRRVIERARGEDAWGRLTPRQIEAALLSVESVGERGPECDRLERTRWRMLLETWEDCEPSQRGDVLLRAITAVVEETNFSGRDFDRAVWEATREAMEELIAHLESGPGGSDER